MKIEDCYVGQRVQCKCCGRVASITSIDSMCEVNFDVDGMDWVPPGYLKPIATAPNETSGPNCPNQGASAEGPLKIPSEEKMLAAVDAFHKAFPESVGWLHEYCDPTELPWPPRAKHVHTWKEYTGLNECFTYCSECDARNKT